MKKYLQGELERRGYEKEKVLFQQVFLFQAQVLGEFNQSTVWNSFSSLRDI